MPIAHVNIAAGRRPEQVSAMARAITQAIAESLQAPVETIRVLVTEVDQDRWFSGGQSLAERAAATREGK